MKELDVVVLMHDFPGYGLKAGDVGTVVHGYPTEGYEVEFVRADGETIAVLTLKSTDIRSMNEAEILHVRKLSPAA